MDAFGGDSDLSDVSAPPTPGPAATPRAVSSDPVAPAKPEASAPTTTGSSRPTSARRTSRRVAEAALEPPTPAKLEPTPSKASSSTFTDSPVADTPTSARRASTRDRRLPAKLRSHSPPAEKSSPTTKSFNAASTSCSTVDTPKPARLKVKLNVKGKSSADGESGSSRGATPQPGPASASGTKITIKMGGSKQKLSDDLRDLADDDGDEQDGKAAAKQEEADDFVPDEEAKSGKDAAEQQKYGKRNRDARNKALGRRRTLVADDEEDDDEADEAPKAPQRKRAKLSDSPAGGAKAKGRSTRGGRKAVDYSDDDDEDEEMVDAASDEDDLADAAALDTDEDLDDEDRPSRGSKARKGRAAADSTKKASGRASTAAAKTSGAAGGKKVTTAASTSSAASSAAAGKAMSAEARMRASIDAALDKSVKLSGVSAPSASKLNPQASAFRPGSAVKAGPGGASTPTGAGRPGTTPSAAAAATGGAGIKRPSTGGGGKPAFGKSMSGWDQLFGGISGLSTASASNKSTPTKPAGASKPSTPTAGTGSVSGTGIRPDPVLESASLADVQRLKEQAVEEHLNTDECFDLLAHADIMLAFERSVYMEDKRLATRLRPAFWKAGMALQGKQQQQGAQPQQNASQAT